MLQPMHWRLCRSILCPFQTRPNGRSPIPADLRRFRRRHRRLHHRLLRPLETLLLLLLLLLLRLLLARRPLTPPVIRRTSLWSIRSKREAHGTGSGSGGGGIITRCTLYVQLTRIGSASRRCLQRNFSPVYKNMATNCWIGSLIFLSPLQIEFAIVQLDASHAVVCNTTTALAIISERPMRLCLQRHRGLSVRIRD